MPKSGASLATGGLPSATSISPWSRWAPAGDSTPPMSSTPSSASSPASGWITSSRSGQPSPTSPGTRPGSSNRAPRQLLATFLRKPFRSSPKRRGRPRWTSFGSREPDPSRSRISPLARGFRERNADVATAVAMVLRQRGFAISEAAIGAGIGSARLPGRLEQMPGTLDPAVWIDGAHNEDKIAALTAEAVRRFGGGPPPVIVFGMLSSKDPMPLLAKLGSAASSVVLTEPVVVGRESLTVNAVAGALAASGYTRAIHIEPDPDAAVRFAEGIASREGAPVLVTGLDVSGGSSSPPLVPGPGRGSAANSLANRDRRELARCAPSVRWPCTRQSQRRARSARRSSDTCRS